MSHGAFTVDSVKQRPYLGRLDSAPRVDIAAAYPGADGTAVDAFTAAGARGVVIEAMAPVTPGRRWSQRWPGPAGAVSPSPSPPGFPMPAPMPPTAPDTTSWKPAPCWCRDCAPVRPGY